MLVAKASIVCFLLSVGFFFFVSILLFVSVDVTVSDVVALNNTIVVVRCCHFGCCCCRCCCCCRYICIIYKVVTFVGFTVSSAFSCYCSCYCCYCYCVLKQFAKKTVCVPLVFASDNNKTKNNDKTTKINFNDDGTLKEYTTVNILQNNKKEK